MGWSERAVVDQIGWTATSQQQDFTSQLSVCQCKLLRQGRLWVFLCFVTEHTTCFPLNNQRVVHKAQAIIQQQGTIFVRPWSNYIYLNDSPYLHLSEYRASMLHPRLHHSLLGPF